MLPAAHALAGRGRVALDALAGRGLGRLAAPAPATARCSCASAGERGGFEPDIRFRSDDLAIQLEMVRTTGASGCSPTSCSRAADARRSSPAAIGREVFTLTRGRGRPLERSARRTRSARRPRDRA